MWRVKICRRQYNRLPKPLILIQQKLADLKRAIFKKLDRTNLPRPRKTAPFSRKDVQKRYQATTLPITISMLSNQKPTSRTQNPDNWLLEVIKQLNHTAIEQNKVITRTNSSLCVLCRGTRFLCGKTRCPVMVKVNTFLKSVPLMSSQDISGMSPPSVFIGRIGYPQVYIGPLVPPIHEDTGIYDLPEQWFGKSIDEIVGFRSMLIRGKHLINVNKINQTNKILDQTRELALADNSVDTELNLTKKPQGSITLSDDVQPFGPSAPIRNLRVGNARYNDKIEKAYYDTDLRATNAVVELYNKGVMVSKIQKAFSVGAFGVEKKRRLVPTRWSITAVDDIISKSLVDKVKTFSEINEYQVYESIYLDNIFEILLIPAQWSYESIEAWYPGTAWNPNGTHTAIYSDWETNNGRTTYAAIGGCYYSARLAVCERLQKERRQATAIVLREARPGYIMPIGVWQVRENVRNAMNQQPYKFKNLAQSLQFIANRFEIPLQRWIQQSELLKRALFQRRISDFFTPNTTE
ncbi:MAG: Nre family DNA repair protein [Nitrososphaerota archaeon]|nr:Nre family DNA repair protein [Nitrososphaerota archaeon]